MSRVTPPTPDAVRNSRGDDAVRRRIALAKGDVAALLVGAALVLSMLTWFSWRMVQNVSGDQVVEAQTSAPLHVH